MLKEILESTGKMRVIKELVDFLKEDNRWEDYKEDIADVLFDEYDNYISINIMDMMFKDYDDGDYYRLNKKSNFVTFKKRLISALKKLKILDEFKIFECRKKLEDAIKPDGEIFEYLAYKISNNKEYAKQFNINRTSQAEKWLIDYHLPSVLEEYEDKDKLCLLFTEGIESIKIEQTNYDEFISIGSRASVTTEEYKVTIITDMSKEKIEFTLWKNNVQGIEDELETRELERFSHQTAACL